MLLVINILFEAGHLTRTAFRTGHADKTVAARAARKGQRTLPAEISFPDDVLNVRLWFQNRT